MFPLLKFLIMEHEQEHANNRVLQKNISFYKKSVLNIGSRFYYMVPKEIKDLQSLCSFKQKFKRLIENNNV